MTCVVTAGALNNGRLETRSPGTKTFTASTVDVSLAIAAVSVTYRVVL